MLNFSVFIDKLRSMNPVHKRVTVSMKGEDRVSDALEGITC